MTWKLATFSRFCTLCHFNLQLFCISKVFYGNTKPATCNLFNSTASYFAFFIRSISFRVFTTFTTVTHTT